MKRITLAKRRYRKKKKKKVAEDDDTEEDEDDEAEMNFIVDDGSEVSILSCLPTSRDLDSSY